MQASLRQLADLIGAEIRGNADKLIIGVGAAADAKTQEVTFINEPKYISLVQKSKAGAVITSAEVATKITHDVLIHPNPYWAYAKIAQHFYPRKTVYSGTHKSAWVAPTAVIASDVVVGPNCTIGDYAVVGEGSVLQAGVVVEERAVLGHQCWLSSNVVVSHDCVLGNYVTIQSGAVIGSDGFGFANQNGDWERIPQVGRVVIGDHVEIGANTCIDRGALQDTVIADGVILDNLIQIAHNVHVGENTAIAALSGVAGSARIGKGCTLAGVSKVIGHLEIADGTHIAVDSLVTNDIKQAGAYASSLPLDDIKQWRKNAIRFKQLDDMAKRLKKLEKKINTDSDS